MRTAVKWCTAERKDSTQGFGRLSCHYFGRGYASQFVNAENSVFDQVIWTRSAGRDANDGRSAREPVLSHYFFLFVEVVVGDAGCRIEFVRTTDEIGWKFT